MIKRIDEYMDKFMNALANLLCAKKTFIVFSIIAFLPLIYRLPSTVLDWQQWISQTAIQLIALNVLGYNSNKGTKELMEYIKEMYSMELKEKEDLQEIETILEQRSESDG